MDATTLYEPYATLIAIGPENRRDPPAAVPGKVRGPEGGHPRGEAATGQGGPATAGWPRPAAIRVPARLPYRRDSDHSGRTFSVRWWRPRSLPAAAKSWK